MAGILISCENDLQQVQAIDIDRSGPERTTYNAEYFFSDSGTVKNRLVATKVEMFRGDSNFTRIDDGLELTFFGRTEAENAVLTANNALVYQELGVMEVYNDVEFVNAKGEKLNTEKLIWDQDSDRVYTDHFVKITRAENIIYGKGLVANQDLSWYKITKVTGDLYIKDEEEE